jgi:hypothetical protein
VRPRSGDGHGLIRLGRMAGKRCWTEPLDLVLAHSAMGIVERSLVRQVWEVDGGVLSGWLRVISLFELRVIETMPEPVWLVNTA